MAFDLKRTYSNDTKERSVAAGATVSVEGRALIGSIESGVEVASYSAGGSTTEAIIGFSLNTAIVDATQPVIETIVFGAGAPPAAVLLSHGNLVASTIRVDNATDGVNYTAGGGAAQYAINTTTGSLTVGSSGANDTFTVAYRYTLTALEQQIIRHQRPVNFGSTTQFNLIAFIRGQGEIYTAEYDTSADYSSAVTAYAIASGYFTSVVGTNTVLGRVVSRPTATDPFLGVAFNLA